MPGPLHGYRVIDLTTMIAGPLATMILADQGADVIKVEPPGRGDQTRAAGNQSGGLSASFLNNNRNKRSITIDLKRAEGREALLRLAATADVFIQNFRPGVVDRLGIGEPAVRAIAPKIVYVSMCGFGETGPLRRQADLRSDHPGGLGPGQYPGRLGPEPAAAGAHHRAGQDDGADRGAGGHGGAAGARRRRARGSMSASRCWTPCSPSSGPRTWAARPMSAAR